MEQTDISNDAPLEGSAPAPVSDIRASSNVVENSSGSDTRQSPSAVNSQPTSVALWLRRADQMLLGTLLIALLVLLVLFRWKLSGGWQSPIEISSQKPREYFYTIDINKASWVEWAQLDGIGEKLARRIVEDRDSRGPFTSIDEVRRVRGLGPKLIEKLRPFLQCHVSAAEPAAADQSSVTEPH